MPSKYVKIAVFVPVAQADAVRAALGQAGAGQLGHYRDCSFSSKGVGRFRPQQGAKPYIGSIDQLEEVEEERIETLCERTKLAQVLAAMKAAHPYEEVAFDVWNLEDVCFNEK